MATAKKDGIQMADVAALNATPDASGDKAEEAYVPSGDPNGPLEARYADGEDGTPFLSEGMRHDLYLHGKAVDPNTGRTVVRA